MQIARVKGNVVSTHKTSKLQGLKLLLVAPIDLTTFEEKGPPVVAIDTVGAGIGEVVMLCSGSSSRQTEMTDGKPSDLAIIAIIDFIEYENKQIYNKSSSSN